MHALYWMCYTEGLWACMQLLTKKISFLLFVFLSHVTECCDQVFITSALCSEGPGFDSGPRDWLS